MATVSAGDYVCDAGCGRHSYGNCLLPITQVCASANVALVVQRLDSLFDCPDLKHSLESSDRTGEKCSALSKFV
jgi:hypothetical protein